MKSPGYQKFSMVVYNEKEHSLHDIDVFDQSLPITFPAYKIIQLILEIRYLANILEPVKISTVNSLLQITSYIWITELWFYRTNEFLVLFWLEKNGCVIPLEINAAHALGKKLKYILDNLKSNMMWLLIKNNKPEMHMIMDRNCNHGLGVTECVKVAVMLMKCCLS